MTRGATSSAMADDFPGRSAAELEAVGAAWTAGEIAQQPTVWLQVAQQVDAARAELHRFLAPLLADPALRIVLAGAGTSAFIGDCLAPPLAGHLRRRVDAIATTDLVSGPHLHLQPEVPTLLVSFARSGNSPESIAAVELAEHFLEKPNHLVITCNTDGALAERARRMTNAAAIVLPEVTNDRGFAMTSSFSSMVLAASLAFDLLEASRVPHLARAGRATLASAHPLARQLAARGFERVVFLGSNELCGLSSEAALKLLELTDGRTVAMAGSVLGFRHGPKTIINDRTMVVLFLSNDPYVRAYDRDLLEELRRDARAGTVLALGTDRDQQRDPMQLCFEGMADATDIEIALLDILFAQLLAFHQSLALGLTPDRPNVAGVVNRVVQGVTIHPWRAGSGDVPGR